MKCFLLAAGMGTRLKPITNKTPKCLVSVNGKPLLEYWFDIFEKYAVDEVLINVHYLSQKVEFFIKEFNPKIKVNLIHEDTLLGSLGSLINNLQYYEDDKSVLVCYADNLTNINLDKFINFHKSHKDPVTIALFEAPTPKECGILELNENGLVVSFEEKPSSPRSNLANAGIYLIDIDVLKEFSKINMPCDIAFDFLPHFIGRMKGYKLEEFLYDIGDLHKLKYAENYVKSNPSLF